MNPTDRELASKHVVELLQLRAAARSIAFAEIVDVVRALDDKNFVALANRMHDFGEKVRALTEARENLEAEEALLPKVRLDRFLSPDPDDWVRRFTVDEMVEQELHLDVGSLQRLADANQPYYEDPVVEAVIERIERKDYRYSDVDILVKAYRRVASQAESVA
jgi:hypothetical protein